MHATASTQTAAAAVGMKAAEGVASGSSQPVTSRVVRDKRNIELLQGSARILQVNICA